MSTTTTTTMKAARFYGPKNILIDAVPPPPSPPPPSTLNISVLWGGICGTDLHEYTTGPSRLVVPPQTLGHEFCGRIHELPTNYSGPLKVGQPVMVDPRLNCGECETCHDGNDHLCPQWGFVGLSKGCGGGFSEFVNVQERVCYALPDDGSVDLDDAVLIEPLTVARHAIVASGIAEEEYRGLTALVVGGGPVGLAVLFNLRAVGVGRVLVSEPTMRRSEMVKGLGLAKEEDVLNPLAVDLVGECKKATGGKGVDVVFDCAGIPAAMTSAMDALKVKGIYTNVAGWEKPFVLPMGVCMLKEMTVKFSMAYNHVDFKAVVDDFIAGKYAGAGKMITSRIALEDLALKGFDELITNKDEHVKIVATPKRELLK